MSSPGETDPNLQNGSPPILSLPNELFSDIFVQCIGPVIPLYTGPDVWPLLTHRKPSWRINDISESPDFITPRLQKWVSLMLVCRRWYRILIQTRVIWRSPVFDQEHLALMMISHSNEVPLLVRNDLRKEQPWFNEFLGPQQGLSRCRELILNISLDKELELRNLAACLSTSAPQLEVLSLRAAYGSRHPNATRLPEALLQGATELRTLALANYSIQTFHHLPFRNLAVLVLYEEGGLRCTISEVATLLRQTPRLRTLVLWSFDRRHSTGAPLTLPSSSIVTLPALSKASISGDLTQVVNMLWHLSFPSSATLELYAPCPQSSDSISQLQSLLRRHYDGTKLLQTTNTGIETAEARCVDSELLSASVDWTIDTLTVRGFATSDMHLDARDDPDPLISVTLEEAPLIPLNLIPDVLRTLDAKTLTTLHMAEWPPAPFFATEDFGTRLWSAVPNVQHLGIKLPYESDDLIRSLTSDPTMTPSCRLPLLKEWHIRGTSYGGLSRPHLRVTLRDCLRSRAYSGFRLRLLRFDKCGKSVGRYAEEIIQDDSVDEVTWETSA
ncbi:hypothetical protein CONPUDRAFT_145776 [Coniophora puteana RWD-64-598 SS2]|uniref:Uncharacterized protein n=1 Tax=Coniophora puteana (strain RWD-64-598) TaxID=741705 RepID=A0A5M3MHB4_CONPW|nr:uncharacterized protein CONPUDRAFT_145776 [Coniophora puteana RWD-64-598 SS2]EIW78618.1 hypothetical protein CONPUDRAFT_145776 [Coniophora puteana RWD-64-598 SS2]